MFLGQNELKLTFGVDLEIGKAYVDRPIPPDNLYWSKRKLYVPPVSGFMFLPIYADLAYRCGIPKTELLAEAPLRTAEAILHSAMKLEMKQIDWAGHVAECIDVARAGKVNAVLMEDLKHYFSGQAAPSGLSYGTPFPSLNRADTYLFYLLSFQFSREQLSLLLDAWYAMISYFLIMDDLADIREDLEKKEENAFVDAGLTEEGTATVMSMMDDAHDKMLRINPVMANRIDYKRATLDVRAIIQSIIQSPKS